MNPGHTRRAPGRAFAALAPLAFALAIAITVAPAAADDLAASPLNALLDMEVSGASKFTLRMSDTASSVSVMTAEQMRALGVRTLADVLQTMRGLVVSSDRTYSYLGVRGLATPGDYNTRVLVLIDGNRINDTVYDQAFLGQEFPVDLDLVERVEFIPGQGSAVHGANALYGVVNVVLRHPAQSSGRELAVGLAPGRTRQARATGSIEFASGASLMLSASGLRMGGTDAVYADGSVSRDTDHERASKLLARYSAGDVDVTLIHGDRTKGLTNIAGTAFGDSRSLYRDTETLLNLALDRRIDDTSRWKLRAYAGAYDFRADYAMDTTPVAINRDGAVSRWWGVEGNVFTERFTDHKLVLGTDWQVSARRDQTNADLDPYSLLLDDHRSGHRIAVFAEDQWTPWAALSFTLGARWDRLESGDASFSPRLAAVWRAGERVTFKFSHGSAFRPANAYEAFYATPTTGGYKGNDQLAPEKVTGDELVAELRPDTSTRATLSLYANRARDLLVQTVDERDGLLVFNNAGGFDAHGVEAEWEHVWPTGTLLRANLSLHRVNGGSAEGIAANNAARRAKLIAIHPVAPHWTLGVASVVASHRGEVPGYGTTSLTLTRTLAGQRGFVSASIDDVFDRQPSDPGADSVLQGSTPQYGRSLRLKLGLAF